MKNNIPKLINYIKNSNRIVFFGGAGASTESGVPDFRSKDGLYNQNNLSFDRFPPEYLLSHDCLIKHPAAFFSFCRQKLDARGVLPNITHRVLAKMEECGKLSAIITQNIDGLHQKAGNKNVIEVHGTMATGHCMDCGKEHPGDILFEAKNIVPRCECGGIVRPDVTLYEESLPDDAVAAALDAVRNADMLIVGGTSLRVYPAANFVYEFCGDHLVVINKEKLPVTLSDESDLFIESSLGDVFREIEKVL